MQGTVWFFSKYQQPDSSFQHWPAFRFSKWVSPTIQFSSDTKYHQKLAQIPQVRDLIPRGCPCFTQHLYTGCPAQVVCIFACLTTNLEGSRFDHSSNDFQSSGKLFLLSPVCYKGFDSGTTQWKRKLEVEAESLHTPFRHIILPAPRRVH